MVWDAGGRVEKMKDWGFQQKPPAVVWEVRGGGGSQKKKKGLSVKNGTGGGTRVRGRAKV